MSSRGPSLPLRDARAKAGGPVELTVLGSSSGDVVLWRTQGKLFATVIVKATFAFTPEGAMTIVAPEAIAAAEAHHRDNPSRSVRLTSDRAPYLPGADVVLTGHAVAPGGTPVKSMAVRLMVFRDRSLLDKAIHVYGDARGPERAAFDRMPLVYERAYGGIGFHENPLGVGAGAAGGQVPNLVDPRDPMRVACFGPISRGWPLRKRLLGSADRAALDARIAEIPAGFDWSYFQAAPPDQRIPYLEGDEWIVLEGVHAAAPYLQSCLPGARAIARIDNFPGSAESQWLRLAADTLRIDADALRCSVVWRGRLPIGESVAEAEAALAAMQIVAGVDAAGQSLAWPPPASSRAPDSEPPVSLSEVELDEIEVARPGLLPAPSPERAAAPAGRFEGTMHLETLEPNESEGRPTMPFKDGVPDLPPPASRRAPPRPIDRARTATLDLAAFEAPPPDVAELPFAPAAREHPAPKAVAAPSAAAVPLAAVPRAGAAPSAAAVPPAAVPRAGAAPSAAAVPPAAVPPAAVPRAISVAPPAYASGAVPLTPSSAAAPPVDEAPPTAPRARGASKPSRVTAEGIALFHEPALAVTAIPWGEGAARDCLTVIAKLTCDLAPSGPAAPRDLAEPLSEDVVEGDGARLICVYPSDLALFKVRADVVLVGHACAPSGAVTTMAVAFSFGHAPSAFDRKLTAFGDRTWIQGRAALKPSPPAPFVRMPLRYDRAFGGPRSEANPAGIGHRDRLRRNQPPGALPNLEDPDRPIRTPNQTPAPACFAPVPLAWKARWAERDTARTASLPELFDWTRFQIAPRAQQLSFLRGDEPFSIAGAHARHAAIAGSLPGRRVRCFAVREAPRDGARAASPHDPRAPKDLGAVRDRGAALRLDEVALRLDTAVFDVDRLALQLVWRGAIPVLDERRPGISALHLVTEPAFDEGISLSAARDRFLPR